MIQVSKPKPKPPAPKPEPEPQESNMTDISFSTVDRDRIKATYDRVAAPNLQLQTEEGVADALDEATDPLSLRFAALEVGQAEIKAIQAQILELLSPPPAPPA
jgi:hypothetical protein